MPQPHCLCYVTNLEDTRVRRDEKAAIKMISGKFTTAVWNHSVIVFTHAGKVANLRVSLQNRSRVIREAIAKHGGATNPGKIPTVPVENDLGYLRRRPVLKHWRGDLYSRVFSVIDEQGLLPLMSATSDLVQPSDSKALDEPEYPEAKTKVVLTQTYTNTSKARQQAHQRGHHWHPGDHWHDCLRSNKRHGGSRRRCRRRNHRLFCLDLCLRSLARHPFVNLGV